jgi:hypothetical protein
VSIGARYKTGVGASCSVGLGIDDPEHAIRIASELVTRGLAETVRALVETQLVEVTRRGGAVQVAQRVDEHLAADRRERGKGCDLSHDEWSRYFNGCALIVPDLRVARYDFTFNTEAELARRYFESATIEVRRLDDAIATVSQRRRRPALFDAMDALFSFCYRTKLVARFHA